jgi:hypothetical protein
VEKGRPWVGNRKQMIRKHRDTEIERERERERRTSLQMDEVQWVGRRRSITR